MDVYLCMHLVFMLWQILGAGRVQKHLLKKKNNNKRKIDLNFQKLLHESVSHKNT